MVCPMMLSSRKRMSEPNPAPRAEARAAVVRNSGNSHRDLTGGEGWEAFNGVARVYGM